MSRKRKAAMTAARLARIRDKIADRARADLMKIDNGIRQTEAGIGSLEDRRLAVDQKIRPAQGEVLDPKTFAAGRWASKNLSQAIRSEKRDLEKQKIGRVDAQKKVRALAYEAEKTKRIPSTLEKEVMEYTAKKTAKDLDEFGSQASRRKKRKASEEKAS
jgi:hypothetical protein